MPSSTRRLTAVVAAVGALVALPSAAQAHRAPSSDSVAGHVVKADQALTRFERAVRQDHAKTAEQHLRKARSQAAAAAREARKLRRDARSAAKRLVAAEALALSSAQYDAIVESIIARIDEVSGKLQAHLAQVLPGSVNGREQALAILTSLLDRLPAEAQGPLASVIAMLSAESGDEAADLAALLDGDLPAEVSTIVADVMGIAQTAIADAFARVREILPMLPAAARGPVEQILTLVSGTVDTALGSVTGILDSVGSIVNGVLGSVPGAGATSPLSSGGGLLGGLLGR